MTFPLSVGATIVLNPDRPTPDGVAALLRKYPVTVFFGVPTFYAAFLASPNAPQKDEVKLRRCLSAGEALPEDIARKCFRSATASRFPTASAPPRCCTSFSPTPGRDQVRHHRQGRAGLRDQARSARTASRSSGRDGRDVCARADQRDHVLEQPREVARRPSSGEWTRSGDKYIEDEDGYYVCCGRADDMLKVSGMYVSPFEVEAALSSHPDVLEAAVVGWNDEQKLIKPKAFVVLKIAGQGDRRAGRARCRST